MLNLFENMAIIDLTHPIDENIPTWEGDSGFKIHIDMDYDKGARVIRYEMRAGIGTHIDAPAHFFQGAATASDIIPEKLFVKACVIDVREKVAGNSEYMIGQEDIVQWEAKNGTIEKGTLCFFYTGWSNYWSDFKKYRNEDVRGVMHFPSIDQTAAELLIERDVVGIGIDTLSPDLPGGTFAVHKKVLGAGKYMLENVANLDKMPSLGAYVIVAPLKIKNGAESAVRLFGLVP